jgi:integrase
MGRFIRVFPKIELITHESLGAWIEKRLREPKERGGGPRTPTTINRELSFLRRLLNWAVNTGKIEKNPMMGFTFLEEANHRERILSTDERKRLMEALNDPHYSSIRLIVLIALYCGMRKGEILNLTWEDIDERERVFDLLRTKSKRGIKRRRRKVPIPPSILGELKKHSRTSAWLFPSSSDPLKPIGEITKSFTSLLNKAKITGFHFHDLRHVAATLMAEVGVHPRIMMEIFGWSSMKMAERYMNPNQEALRQAVNAISQKIESHNP